MKMPPCKSDGKRIVGVAYSNRKRDGYLCKFHRDEEEKKLEEEYEPIEKEEKKVQSIKY